MFQLESLICIGSSLGSKSKDPGNVNPFQLGISILGTCLTDNFFLPKFLVKLIWIKQELMPVVLAVQCLSFKTLQ